MTKLPTHRTAIEKAEEAGRRISFPHQTKTTDQVVNILDRQRVFLRKKHYCPLLESVPEKDSNSAHQLEKEIWSSLDNTD